jgi:3-hydroxybutyryl-CoA dehydrogenase
MTPIKKIGVIGAGAMGQGIAQVCATAGHDVLFNDVDPKAIDKGIESIRKNLDQAVAKGKLSVERKDEIISLIKPSSLQNLRADLVIEAVVEKLEVKQAIFYELESINPSSTIFASNTSSLSITSIGLRLRHPSRMVGLHFFNPAHLMKLVEVISGKETDLSLIGDLVLFVEALGKTPVVVKDSPGFIVNRVARHYYLESLKMLEQNAADIGTIDALLRSAGFKLGPFELMDLIGNDVNLEVSRLMYNAFDKTPRFKPNPIQEEKVRQGLLGKKTGQGYYHYEKK